MLAHYQDKKLYITLFCLLLRGNIVDFTNVLSLGFLSTIIDVVLTSVFVISIIPLIQKNFKVVSISTIGFACLWFLSSVIHPKTKIFIVENYPQFFIYCLPFFWIGYHLVKKRIYLEYLLPIARIKLIIALIVQIIIILIPSRDIFGGDYQTASYSLVLGLMAAYYLACRDKKKTDIVLSILGTLILFIVGSRSIFVSIIFYWAIWFVINMRKNKWTMFTLFFVAIILLLFSNSILGGISSLANSAGFSTHLVDALSSGEVFNDENRTILYAGFLQLATEETFGYGIMGDRYISDATGLFWKPIYPHNIFIELIVQFGYAIGIALGLFLLISILKILLTSKNYQLIMLVLILTSSTFIKLFFASSFWIDQLFFLLLGVLFASYHYKRVGENI